MPSFSIQHYYTAIPDPYEYNSIICTGLKNQIKYDNISIMVVIVHQIGHKSADIHCTLRYVYTSNTTSRYCRWIFPMVTDVYKLQLQLLLVLGDKRNVHNQFEQCQTLSSSMPIDILCTYIHTPSV